MGFPSSVTIPDTQATDTEVAAAIAAAKLVLQCGDGRDGAITYSVANSRWENGSGVALTDGADYAGVSTTTLVVKTPKYFTNVTVPVGTTLQMGANDTLGYVELSYNGTFNQAGTFCSGYAGETFTDTLSSPNGAVAKTTAGAGTAVLANPASIRHGFAGSSGAAGGDGTNVGGGQLQLSTVVRSPLIQTIDIAFGPTVVAGTTGAGANGAAIGSIQGVVSSPESPWMKRNSPAGHGGSSGALKQAGGSNVGGAGGTGGRGRLPLIRRGNILILAATALTHADGEAGGNGSDGVATNNVLDISGGGGGAGGGAGGPITDLYKVLTDSGATRRSLGGAGGTGGLGMDFLGARPASNGGNGTAGSNGIILAGLMV